MPRPDPGKAGGWLARAARRFQPAAAHAALQASVDRALRAGQPVTLVYLNIERFRAIVRQYGPDGADRVLRTLGDRLAAVFGAAAVVRLPGDEFVIRLPAEPGDASLAAVDEVTRQLSLPIRYRGGSVTLSAAIGVASGPHDGACFQQLYERAEAAMLDLRAAGNRAPRHAGHVDGPPARGGACTAADLRIALERSEFALYYQPQIDLRTGAVSGAEALIRWHHPDRGLVLPGEFIGDAERTGMIVPIGRWVLQEACRQAAAWRAAGFPALRVAVNLSARQFECNALEDIVREALEAAGLPASALELELTETILIHDTENVLCQIRNLKAMGLALSLDDFGTGYSSLSYLKKFSVDKIKIDRSFVSGLGKDANDAAIVRAIVQIARSLGLSTIAEGVEDAQVLGCLQLLECDEVQGYYFSPPLSAPAFEKMLAVLSRHRPLKLVPR